MPFFANSKKTSFLLGIIGLASAFVVSCGSNPETEVLEATSCYGETSEYHSTTFPTAGFELSLKLDNLQSNPINTNLPAGNVARSSKISKRYQRTTTISRASVFYKRVVNSDGTLAPDSTRILLEDPLSVDYEETTISEISRNAVFHPDVTNPDTSFAFAQDTLQFVANTKFPSVGVRGVASNPLRGVYEGFVKNGSSYVPFGKFYSSKETPGTFVPADDSLKKKDYLFDVNFQAQTSTDVWNFPEVEISIEDTTEYGKADTEANTKSGQTFLKTTSTTYQTVVKRDSSNIQIKGNPDPEFVISPDNPPTYDFVADSTKFITTKIVSDVRYRITQSWGTRTVKEDLISTYTKTKVYTLNFQAASFAFSGTLTGTFAYDQSASIKNSDANISITNLIALQGFRYRPWLTRSNGDFAKINETFDGSAPYSLASITSKAAVPLGELSTWDNLIIAIEPNNQPENVVVPWTINAFNSVIDISLADAFKLDFANIKMDTEDRSFLPDTNYVFQFWWLANTANGVLKDITYGGVPNAYTSKKFRFVNNEFRLVADNSLVTNFGIEPYPNSPATLYRKKLGKFVVAVEPLTEPASDNLLLNGIVLVSTHSDSVVADFTKKQNLVFPSKQTFDDIGKVVAGTDTLDTDTVIDSIVFVYKDIDIGSAIIEKDTLRLCFGSLPFIQTQLSGASVRYLNYSYYFWLKGNDGSWTKVDNSTDGKFKIDQVKQFQNNTEIIPDFDLETFGGGPNLKFNVAFKSGSGLNWNNYEGLYLSLTPNPLIGLGGGSTFFSVNNVTEPFFVTPYSFSIPNAIAEGNK
ncbi:hypothetical protein IT568_07235 [bacterium]|nr:hypothetical protein [bacterium]